MLSLLLLLGCATTTPRGGEAVADQLRDPERSSRAALRHWQLSGRAAVNDRDRGWQASVIWQQIDDSYSIDLIGPFGQGQVRLQGDQNGVELSGSGPRLNAVNPDQLLAEATGLRLPLTGLRYWLRALPAPQSENRISYDAQGRVYQLRQDGWFIEYLDYQTIDGVQLPRRMRASRDRLTVKLVVQTWKLTTPT